MDNIEEIWKDVPWYEGYYQVSNLGGIRSLDRRDSIGRKVAGKDKYIGRLRNGYLKVDLSRNGVSKSITVHKLVAYAFLNHDKSDGLVVNHKNHKRHDNRLSNLELITQKANVSNKSEKYSKNFTSQYQGVYGRMRKNVYRYNAAIRVNGKKKYLGSFDLESDAHKAYQKALKELKNA